MPNAPGHDKAAIAVRCGSGQNPLSPKSKRRSRNSVREKLYRLQGTSIFMRSSFCSTADFFFYCSYWSRRSRQNITSDRRKIQADRGDSNTSEGGRIENLTARYGEPNERAIAIERQVSQVLPAPLSVLLTIPKGV